MTPSINDSVKSAADKYIADTSTLTTAQASFGDPADAAWSGSGSGGIIALLKSLYAKFGTVNNLGSSDGTSLSAQGILVWAAGMLFNGTAGASARQRSAIGAALVNTGIGSMSVEEGGRTYNHISTAATTVVKSSAGHLHTITINSLGTVASILTVYDNTAGSGTVIAVIDSLNFRGTLKYDIAFTTGLTIVSTGTVAPDVTVSYR